MRSLISFLIAVSMCTFLATCASSPTESGVLEPLEEKPAPSLEAGPAEAPPVQSPALQKLLDLFKTLGYEAVGMTYEDEPTLNLLHKVFSDPAAANRAIRLVYTGLQLAYDAKAQSLTVGGTKDSKAILAFLKKIPLRAAQ